MQTTETLVYEERAARGVNSVQLHGLGELAITQGDEEGLTVQAEESILPLIQTEVSDGKLTIGFRRHTQPIRPTMRIRFDLRLRQLRGLAVSGSGSARSAQIRAERLDVEISGSGSVQLDEIAAGWLGTNISGSGCFQVAGEAPEHRVQISGSGGLQAESLRTREADVTVSGSGSATVHASDKLNAVISGSGSVVYSGNPHVSQVTSGSGRVRVR
jgi:hypothetical protein